MLQNQTKNIFKSKKNQTETQTKTLPQQTKPNGQQKEIESIVSKSITQFVIYVK